MMAPNRITFALRVVAATIILCLHSATGIDAADVLVGPGIASMSGADSGNRLNIDQANPSATLAPGTYNVSDFSYWSTSSSGSVTPFLAQQRSGNAYTTLWVGSAVAPGATGLQGATYTAGAEQFTLVDPAPIFAGHFMSSGGRVAFAGGGQTDHDNSFTGPSNAGQFVSGFSNANLGRTYSYGIDVDDASVTSTAGLSLVPGVFNTGVDASGNVLSPGASDPHWTITSSPPASGFGGAAVVQSNHPAWLANDPVGSPFSSWISTVSAGTTNIPPGNYVFETTFDLSGFDPAMTELVMNIAADNSYDVLLNGNSTGVSGGGFNSFDGPLFITAGFLDGINTLEVVLNNAGTSNNPGGLRAELAVFSAPPVVPEPTSIAIWSLLGLALAGFGYHRVRRRK